MSSTIKTAINANIKQNGVQAITGTVLNSVLNAMVDDADSQIEDVKEDVETLENKTAYIGEEDSTTIVRSDAKFLYKVEVGEDVTLGGDLTMGQGTFSTEGVVSIGQIGNVEDKIRTQGNEITQSKTRLTSLENKTNSISKSGNETIINSDVRLNSLLLLKEDIEGEDLSVKAELEPDDYKIIMSLGSQSLGEEGAIVRHVLDPKQDDDAVNRKYVLDRVSPLQSKTQNITQSSDALIIETDTDVDGSLTVEEDLSVVGVLRTPELYLSGANVENELSDLKSKTSKISHTNNKTTISENLNISGALSVANEINTPSIGGVVNGSQYIEFGTNKTDFFDKDGNPGDIQVKDIYYGDGTKKLSELAQKINNLVVIDNENV